MIPTLTSLPFPSPLESTKQNRLEQTLIYSLVPVIPLLGIYLMECAPAYDRATCTPIFIAALFTIAKLWK
jgi:hypothetical protein